MSVSLHSVRVLPSCACVISESQSCYLVHVFFQCHSVATSCMCSSSVIDVTVLLPCVCVLSGSHTVQLSPSPVRCTEQAGHFLFQPSIIFFVHSAVYLLHVCSINRATQTTWAMQATWARQTTWATWTNWAWRTARGTRGDLKKISIITNPSGWMQEKGVHI